MTDPAPRTRCLQETLYYTRDLDAAVAFHVERLGFRVMKRFDWGFALLDADGGEGRIGLMDAGMADPDPTDPEALPRPRVSIQVADIDAEMERLRAAGVSLGRVGGEKGSHRAVDAYDPEGNAVFLWEDGSGRV